MVPSELFVNAHEPVAMAVQRFYQLVKGREARWAWGKPGLGHNESYGAGDEEWGGTTEHGKLSAFDVDFQEVNRGKISLVAELRRGL